MGCLHSVSEKCPADEAVKQSCREVRFKNPLVCTGLHCSCGTYCSSVESPQTPTSNNNWQHQHQEQQCQQQSVTAVVGNSNNNGFSNHCCMAIGDFGSQVRIPQPFSPSFIRAAAKKRRNHLDARVGSKYNAVSLIGKGSFSVVLKVQSRHDDRSAFAMKIMPANRGKGSFENELLILSRVRHQNVIQLIEVIRSSTRIYVVLELAVGGELYDRITQKGSYTEVESIYAIRQILQGVSYLHRVGVTHRDLKPENLLYVTKCADSKLVINDFGLAHLQQTADDQYMTDPCGTPEYIAPEILTRLPYTNKVDIWAVGVIAYILLAGIMPFDDENRTALYRQILRGKYYFYPEFWQGIGEEAKQFVACLLCVDSDIRPTADSALRHPWLQRVVQRVQLDQMPRTVHKSHSLNMENKRTRSSRSVRSVARSDASRRIRKDEVDRLHKDPEILKLLTSHSTAPVTRNYGLV